MNNMWLRRISEFIEPTAAELTALEGSKLERRTLKRNGIISRQGECVTEVYFVIHGWVGSSLEMSTGRDQLANIFLPGDFAGLPDIALKRAATTLIALTDVTVDVIPLDRLARLFEKAPRFLFMLFVMTQRERVVLMDQLAMVGQSRAIQRVASLILHIHARLSILRAEPSNIVNWPLTQQRVAEAVGLTSVHVNRTFRELTEQGLIERKGREIRLLDLKALSELSGMPERTFAKEPAWLVDCCLPSNEGEIPSHLDSLACRERYS